MKDRLLFWLGPLLGGGGRRGLPVTSPCTWTGRQGPRISFQMTSASFVVGVVIVVVFNGGLPPVLHCQTNAWRGIATGCVCMCVRPVWVWISAESSLLFPRRPNRSRDWTEPICVCMRVSACLERCDLFNLNRTIIYLYTICITVNVNVHL